MRGRLPYLALLVVASGAPVLAAQQTAARSGAGAPSRRAAPAPLPADVRQGFWFGGGLGAGSGGLHCSICTGDQESGTAAHVRAGTTVSRHWLIGGEVSGWRKGVEDGSRRVLALTGTAYWYPDPRHGYYVKGGFGVSQFRSRVDQESLTARAFALHAGAGYEIRLNPALSIVPFLSVLGSSQGALWLEERDAVSVNRSRLPASANTLLVQLGIGVTRH